MGHVNRQVAEAKAAAEVQAKAKAKANAKAKAKAEEESEAAADKTSAEQVAAVARVATLHSLSFSL